LQLIECADVNGKMKVFAILPLALALTACGAGDNKPEDPGDTSAAETESHDAKAEQDADTTNEDKSVKRQLFSITSVTNSGGVVTPESQENIEENQRAEFSITPAPGYEVQEILGCEGALTDSIFITSPMQESCELNVVFRPINFTITTLVSGVGALAPDASEVSLDETVEFEVIPGAGQRLTAITGCNGTLYQQTYTTSATTEDCIISAYFSPQTYTVTTSVSTGGIISPTPLAVVDYGSTLSLTPLPDNGYRLNTITGCNGELNEGIYITAPFVNDCTIDVTFEPIQHTVTLMQNYGGGIEPELPAMFPYDQAVNWTITVDNGYEITSVTGCGGVLSDSVYSASIEADCQITAEFRKIEYIVSREISGGGALTRNINGPFIHGETYNFTIEPDDGYDLVSIEGCEGTLENNIYTTSALISDCKITAQFEIKQYSVTVNYNEGGYWSPVIPDRVDHGSSVSFSLTADTGYKVSKVEGCGGILSGNTFTIGSVEDDCEIIIEYAIKTYIIGTYANSGGAIVPYTDTRLAYGETATYEVIPSQYYYLKSISGCDGTLDGQTYTVGPARAHCRFSATFERIKYSITPDPEHGGSLSPSAVQSIYPQSFAIFTIEPDIGYKIDNVRGCPGERSGNRVKVTEMTENCTLTVTFDRINTAARLNDTGVNWSGDNLSGNNIDCPSDLPGGQDCNSGRDALNAAGYLIKTGAGSAGFDYTKVDDQGIDLPENAGEWSCVRDNHTGLEWEVKTDTGLRSKSDTFHWYNTAIYENGGNEGDSAADYNACYGYDSVNELTFCNTQAYISRINTAGLCGHSDWRLPDIDEIRSIVDYSHTNPTIDTDYFPNTMSTTYWSSSPSTWYLEYPHPEDSVYAWTLDFNRGFDTQGYPPRGEHVRLVRRDSGYDQ
jgi:hypothetical protein